MRNLRKPIVGFSFIDARSENSEKHPNIFTRPKPRKDDRAGIIQNANTRTTKPTYANCNVLFMSTHLMRRPPVRAPP